MDGLHQGEQVLYKGTPSQTVNFRVFIVCTILFLAAIFAPTIWTEHLAQDFAQFKKIYMLASKVLFFVPFIWAFSAWLKTHNHRYTISSERLMEEEGVLSKVTDELELFRVKDITYAQPFSMRIFGCGNIILDTSDKSTPIVVLHGIKNARPVIELLRKNVQFMREKKGVREID
jgi:uncharacterized membrane protein YdbT with pleckstrin-like domain